MILGAIKQLFQSKRQQELELPKNEILAETLDLTRVEFISPLIEVARTSRMSDHEQRKSGGDLWSEVVEDHSEIGSILAQHIKGSVLLDLGAGSKFEGMYRFAHRMGARAYVAVDVFFSTNSDESITRDLSSQLSITPSSECELIVLKADMLSFLGAVRDASCSVVLNCIDRTIIGNPQYHAYLADEITRVSAPGRLAFGIMSEALALLATSKGAVTPPPIPDKDLASALAGIRTLCHIGQTRDGWEDLSTNLPDRILRRV